MLRHALLATALVLAGCATARTNALIVDDALAPRASEAALAKPGDAPAGVAEATARGGEARPYAEAAAALPATERGDDAPAAFTVKGGYYGSTEDALEDGYILELAWTRPLSKLFAIELEAGYLDADGTDAGVDTDVWSIPIMLNGRLNLPVAFFDFYGGAGIGGFYYDAEAKAGATKTSDDGFLFGGNAFLGASVDVGDTLALGLELKYYLTDEISDLNTGLDAYAVMLTLGFRP